MIYFFIICSNCISSNLFKFGFKKYIQILKKLIYDLHKKICGSYLTKEVDNRHTLYRKLKHNV